MRKLNAQGWKKKTGLGGALETMERGFRRAPSRKRKPGGRAKGGRESTAVNSFYYATLLPSVWASLRLREMVRSGSRPGQVRAADLRRSLCGWRELKGFLGWEKCKSENTKRHCGRFENAGKGEWDGGGGRLIF